MSRDEPSALPHSPTCLCCCHFAVDLEAAEPPPERAGRRARRQKLLLREPLLSLVT